MFSNQLTKPKAFISHSSKDHPFGHKLARDLERDGGQCGRD